MWTSVTDTLDIIATFLENHEVLALSSCTRDAREALFRVNPRLHVVLLSTWMPHLQHVASRVFYKCGHFWVMDRSTRTDVPPGDMVLKQPDVFVQRWLSLPRDQRTDESRKRCLSEILACRRIPWPDKMVLGLRALFRCGHATCPRGGLVCRHLAPMNGWDLLRRASWMCHFQVLRFLVHDADVHVDVENGMPLRLAVCTAVLVPPQDSSDAEQCVALLLEKGADHSRDNMWALRILLREGRFTLAALLYHHFLKGLLPDEMSNIRLQDLERSMAHTSEAFRVLHTTRCSCKCWTSPQPATEDMKEEGPHGVSQVGSGPL